MQLFAAGLMFAIGGPECTSLAAEPCHQNVACRKLIVSSQKHFALAQADLERALAQSGDGSLLKPLSEALLAQQKSDEAIALYKNYITSLAPENPEREVRVGEMSRMLLNMEVKEEPETDSTEAEQEALPPQVLTKQTERATYLPLLPNSSGSASSERCETTNRQKDLRAIGAVVIGVGALGLATGGILWPQRQSTDNDCPFDGRFTRCQDQVGAGAKAAFVLGSAAILSGAITFGFSFRRKAGEPCFISK